MEISFLGTGTSQGIPVIGCHCNVCTSEDSKDKRLRASILIKKDETTVVVDIGPDFRQQMLRERVEHLDAVLLTHEHSDHIAGLDDVRAFNFLQRKSMPVFGLARSLNGIKERFNYIFQGNYPGLPQIELCPVSASAPFLVKDLEITPIQILHGALPILGFRVGKVAYLTDFKYFHPDQCMDDLKNLDVLIISALHHRTHHSHSTLDESIEVARQIGAKKTFFTHFSHYMGLHDDQQDKLPANMFFAYDGLILNI